jgi:flavin reductase (DIM6/NTAB) family NADH-FMN oxidoreductase RutF
MGGAVAADPSMLYRRALGTFATGVTVITAEDAQGPLGLTVNSFTSVSLEPPLILWCLGDESDRRHLFSTTPHFVVNVLAAEDRAHSARFAWGGFRLEPGEVERGPGNAPRLRGALSWLECETRERIQLGDHLVIVGKVVRFDAREGDGLLFFRGGYGAARSEEMT